MLMVIFGAGASYDSYPIQPARDYPRVQWRPPLARELFSREEVRGDAASFPQMTPLVPRLNALPDGISLEDELEKLQHQADEGDEERTIQLAAVRFYLQSAIHHFEENWRAHTRGFTSYRTLLDQIRRWRRGQSDPVCLVTFNYDSILEEARSDFLRRNPPNELKDYVDTDYKIFMLHGSVRWAREIHTEIPEIIKALHGELWVLVKTIINRFPELNVTNNYVVDGIPAGNGPYRDIPLLPAIAIPVQRKDGFECPNEHARMLDELLPKVDRVLMIGWRGREQHFVAKIAHALPESLRTMIVSSNPKSCAETRSFLQACDYPGEIATASDGFSGFVLKEQLEIFVSWSGQSELHLD